MKSLIIGGAGFVGKYLIRQLIGELGHEVVVTKMSHETLDISEVQVRDLNILEEDSVERLLKEEHPDYIFHMAAQSSVAVSWKNPQLTVDVNVKGAVNILETLRKLDYKPRVMLIGSGEEYGNIPLEAVPINEKCVMIPGNIYAATKACQNMLGKIYADAYGLQIMMVRAFNHIGPNQAPIFVVADFCKQVAEIEAGKREAVLRVGNLSAKRDFTDVRDVVRAYSMLISKGMAGETYNIGSGKAIAIEDVLKVILENSKADIQVEVDKTRFRPVDVPIIEANIDKINQLTGWNPQIPLIRTIQDTLDYWRDSV